MNNIHPLPDITSADQAIQPATLQWVGMSGVAVPLYIPNSSGSSIPVSGNAELFVSLDKAEAKGIHMSRLYANLNDLLAQQELTQSALELFLFAMVESQAGISQNACFNVEFDLPLNKKALLSDKAGYQTYTVRLHVEKRQNVAQTRVELAIPYSSTCPCSASLSRQLLAQEIEQQFSAGNIDKEQLLQWIQSEQGTVATPHSQRSFAHIHLTFEDYHCPDLPTLIQHFEQVIGTPVQTAVKRQDEQAFAGLNAQNLMFCEDAARRLKNALEAMEQVSDYWFKVDHQESLHAHNAVAIDQKYPNK